MDLHTFCNINYLCGVISMKLKSSKIIETDAQKAADHPHAWRVLTFIAPKVYSFYCIYCLTIVEVDEDAV